MPLDITTLEFPEGFTKDEAALSSFAELANQHGITKDAAQSLVNFYHQEIKKVTEAGVSMWNEQQRAWQDQVMADPEIGGNNWKGVHESIGKIMNDPAFADPQLKDALDATGAGNHPAIIKFMHKVSKALNEGKAVPAGAPATVKPPGQDRDPAKSLYPDLP